MKSPRRSWTTGRSTTSPRGERPGKDPRSSRGIEADACYLLDPGKLEVAKAAHSKGSNDDTQYPNPDLAIEVDISRPKVDRPGIYAEIGVLDFAQLDGGTPVIERLGAEARYRPVEVSGRLGVNVAQLRRWVVEEDSSNAREWSRRCNLGQENVRQKRRIGQCPSPLLSTILPIASSIRSTTSSAGVPANRSTSATAYFSIKWLQDRQGRAS